ncbi:spore germination protein [Salipaludibacillus neizhouensis]|uniref:Spore germination protein n=1 Tax=Salipaludibacillus neizhouensis TaxID=885475 RepID=A0A3A9KQK4_9BACI|nr:spore germination protein [Salipaludibacillus neizhouensis]RKL66956.1 spore germination protein [Salipaludibacillus neizhouensis]
MRNIFQVAKRIQSLKSSSKKENQKEQNNARLIEKKIEINSRELHRVFKKSVDVKYRNLEVYDKTPVKVFISFINGLVNEEYINLHIMKPLMEPGFFKETEKMISTDFFTNVKNKILSTSNMKEVNTIDDVIDGVLSGETVIFIDGYKSAFLVSTQGFESRSVEEPQTEANVRGPREGFNEVLKVNTTLIRRKIKNSNLAFEDIKIGKQTKTNIRISYIEGIANSEVVEEVKNRLKRIDTDTILESGYIEQFIEDHPFSPFPTIGNSEKPDKVSAKILEGRIAIFCDGTPFVLTVPQVLIETFQVPEDYYSRPYLASVLRLLRLLALFLTVYTPAIYVSIATFHHEMVPAQLLTTMVASAEKVPFPTFLEALIMIITFQLLSEAGVRMPRPIGSAISIVGALVIGEAAVAAGLVSAPMVIVVALTAITGFVVPSLNDSIILSRFFLLFLSAGLGFYGMLTGTVILVAHLCSLRSFGTPYLSPMGPIFLSELKDSIIRMPLWLLQSRPQSINWKKSVRQGSQNKPKHPKT